MGCGLDVAGGADGPVKLLRGAVFLKVSSGAGPEHGGSDRLIIERRKPNDADRLSLMPDAPRGFNPVQVGHLNIHDDHVRLHMPRQLDGFQTVGGLCDHLQVGLAIDDPAQVSADDGVIVSDEDADALGRRTTRPV